MQRHREARGAGFGAVSQARFVLIGTILAALVWIVESAVHVYVWHDVSLFHQVFSPERHEIWQRMTVVAMFVGFGIYAERSFAARKRAEREARKASMEMTQVFETAADGMRIVDRDFSVLRANETFCRLAGLKKDQVVGRKCFEVFSGPNCNTPQCPLRRILRGEKFVTVNSEKHRHGGDTVPCIVTATPFRGAEGEIVGIVEDYKDISDRAKYEEDILKSQEQMRRLALHLQIVREEERGRIARELHDELGQVLTALKLDTHWLSRNVPEDAPLFLEKTRAMAQLIGTTIGTVKRITHDLRPGILDDFGLAAAVEWQTEEFRRHTGIECALAINPDEIVPQRDTATALFRIFQETLTNIARHAEAMRVVISLDEDDDGIRLVIADNGKGIRKEQIAGKDSFGIMGMRERVGALKGHLTITENPGGGTLVRVFVPTRKEVSVS